MDSLLESPLFVFMWLGFLLLMSIGIASLFLWGIRAGQFSHQDRARYLPLESGLPLGAGPEGERGECGREAGGRP